MKTEIKHKLKSIVRYAFLGWIYYLGAAYIAILLSLLPFGKSWTLFFASIYGFMALPVYYPASLLSFECGFFIQVLDRIIVTNSYKMCLLASSYLGIALVGAFIGAIVGIVKFSRKKK